MKKYIILFKFLFFVVNSFSQKINYDIGVKFRITPIYTSPIKGIYFPSTNVILQQDKHLTGKTLENEISIKHKKIKLSYTLGVRVDLVESKFDNTTISDSKNKILLDNSVSFYIQLFSKIDKCIYLCFGLSHNNGNSNYTFSKKQFDNAGNISYTFSTSDYIFKTLNLSIQKQYKKVSGSIGMEYVYKHKFLETANFILPTLSIKYRVK